MSIWELDVGPSKSKENEKKPATPLNCISRPERHFVNNNAVNEGISGPVQKILQDKSV